jgi:hypothetical protein
MKKELTVICHNCNLTVVSVILGEFSNISEYDITVGSKFSLCKCPKCLSPVLVEQDRYLEFGTTFDWGNPVSLYPNNEFYINPVIPIILRSSLLESVKCYKAKANIASVIMCRRTLEIFCKEKGITERYLVNAIKKLKTNGIINEQLFEWADKLKSIGNEAAHDHDVTISELDAKDALDFTIAILDYTYSFKDKFDRFKSRSDKKIKKK